MTDETELFVEIDQTSDLGIEVVGASLDDLYARALLALSRLMVETERVRRLESHEIRVEADSESEAMHDLLAAALNLFAIDGFIWQSAAVERKNRSLSARLTGEPFDPKRHVLQTEIKAVTYHQLSVVEESPGSWRARIIFDV
jgi:SHS2 domain-containing protein